MRDGGDAAAVLRHLGVSVEPPPLRSHLQLMPRTGTGMGQQQQQQEMEEEDEQEAEVELMGVTVSCYPCARCACQ